MRRFHRMAGALASTALGLSGLALTASPAAANHNSQPPCLVVTQDTRLTGNVGPCSGHGIIVAADNITLDLGGFTVSGAQTPMEQAGVLLDDVTGVTVKNGTVTGFDAGVAIEGGGGNTVTGITATGNVNDMMEPIDPRRIIVDRPVPTPQQMHDINLITCNYGDGITVVESSNNVISGNTVTENGPYSGISLVGDSNQNLVSKNQVHENDLLNNGVVDAQGNPIFVGGPTGAPALRGFHVPAGTPGAVRPQSMCGATEIGTPGMGRGREVQSIGIRIEGPGADENVVDKNTVTKSGLAGISFHSYVFTAPAPNRPPEESNRFNTVSKNSVSLTGMDTNQADPFADGIASLASGPTGTITRPSDTNTIVKNESFDNFRHGISLGRLSFGFTVDKNVVTNNGGSGIWVAGPGTGNGDARGAHDNFLTKNRGSGNLQDGTDLNPNCDNNRWSGNNFVTVNQPCVAAGNTGKGPKVDGNGKAGRSEEAKRGGLGRGGR